MKSDAMKRQFAINGGYLPVFLIHALDRHVHLRLPLPSTPFTSMSLLPVRFVWDKDLG